MDYERMWKDLMEALDNFESLAQETLHIDGQVLFLDIDTTTYWLKRAKDIEKKYSTNPLLGGNGDIVW